MAKLNKQPERWLTQEEFDSLDPTTIPQGTVINVVGVDYHRYKIEYDTGDIGYGYHTYYVDTPASNLNELASYLITEKVIKGYMLLPPNEMWMTTSDTFGDVVLHVSSATVGGNTLTISGSYLFHCIEAGQINADKITNAPYTITGAVTITKLW